MPQQLPTKAELDTAAAIVYAAMPPTPQYSWPLLNEALGTEVWVKHENHTPTGAFKVRGGLVYIHELAQRAPEVVMIYSGVAAISSAASFSCNCWRSGKKPCGVP